MKLDKRSLLLYAVTDRTWLGGRTLADAVHDALEGGATFLQLREKNLDDDSFLQLALEIKEIAAKYKVPFVINDNINVALACGADGVHVGQKDMAAKDVRKIIGPDKILGVSAQTVEQAVAAEENGADYLGVGSVFSTSTKLDADAVSFETLKEICQAVSIPVVAIGGINKDNARKLKGSGIDGIAVVSAIFAQENIREAAAELRQIAREVVGNED
ncbi:MAG: thiamine phosphate synthase [Firmicutes bacterium]|nr:thiamine phosphate synthase [Bacillota bacterium]HOB22807.1 thiamine phosphate synthase [Bacillota bacterium]